MSNFDDLEAAFGADPEHPADIRHETENALRARVEELEAHMRAIIQLPHDNEPSMDTEFGAGFYVALSLAKDIAREALGQGDAPKGGE